MPVLTITSNDVPAHLRGPVAVSQFNLPRFWPTIYCDVFKADRKLSTLSRILRAIDNLYRFGDGMMPAHDPDRLLTQLDISGLKNLMAGYLSHLRSTAAIGSVGAEQSWRAAFDFVYDVLKILGISGFDAKRLHVELHELKALYGQLSPCRPSQRRHITAVPAIVVADIFEILALGGARNPFRGDDNQVRNQLIFEILLRTGLRRGELLGLGLDALQSEFDPNVGRPRFWINVAEDHADEDPRFLKSSLKTANSWRSIPVPQDLAYRIQGYIDGHRVLSQHPFLLVSNQGRPLSAASIGAILEIVSARVSPQARQALRIREMERVRAHDLRHTAVVARLQMFRNAGVSLDESIERLRPYFGWAPGSKMPLHYGQAFFETQFADIWAESFEDHLAALRQIMGGDQ